MSIEAGTRLGPYEIGPLLGRGGMGEVYEATDLRLERRVAIKVLPANVAQDASRLTRFRREARALAALSHPNVATIHAFEREGPVSFIALELVKGPTLADRIADSALPIEEAVPLFLRIAKGLEAAHRAGIVHRDLKPANLKLTEDLEVKVKILDFGLARVRRSAAVPEHDRTVAGRPGNAQGEAARAAQTKLSQAPTLPFDGATRPGPHFLGTLGYMSPEQLRGARVGTATDYWGFGCCLFEALTGSRLFSPDDVGTMHDTGRFVPPDLTALSSFSLPLRELLGDCLALDPADRPSSWAAVRDRLEDLLESEHFQLSNELLCYANPDGTFGRVNQSFEHALGWKTAELRGKPFADFIHPADLERTLLEFKGLLEGKETEGFVNRYRCSDGSYIGLRWRARVRRSTGQIVAIATIVSDN